MERAGRHYSFAKYLKRAGHDPVIFCSNAKHNTESEIFCKVDWCMAEKAAENGSIPFVFIKSRPYSGNGGQRILNMIDFFCNVQKGAVAYAREHGRPDVIIGSSVHPLACAAAIRLSKNFGCKNVVEIRDLWPESIVAYNLASKNNLIVRMLYALEKWIYSSADAIIFTMEGGKDYIVEKGWDASHCGPVDLNKVYHINNGVDLEEFNYNREHYSLSDFDLDNQDIWKVVYTGSVRLTNHLENIVEAARLLHDNDLIKIIIFGDGNMRERLDKKVQELGLKNITFKGRVDKKYVPSIISKADLCITDTFSNDLLRFGISPNKLFDYIAAEKPILSCLVCNYDIVKKYHLGMTVSGSDSKAIAEAIVRIMSSEVDYQKGLKIAKHEYSFKQLTERLIEVVGNV